MATVDEARDLLGKVEFDRKRTNELSGKVLLALAGLTPDSEWREATRDPRTVREVINWIRDHIDGTEPDREDVRRRVLKQFAEVGFAIHNEDDPHRLTNSALNNYRLSTSTLDVVRGYGSDQFGTLVDKYTANHRTYLEKILKERDRNYYNITLPQGVMAQISKGGQNDLIVDMIQEFCPQFIDNGRVLYIGDADNKFAHYDKKELEELGVTLDDHGKMPDLIVYEPDKNWLFLMEACSTHGPVDHSRYSELHELFSESTAGLVLVSCFPDRATFRSFVPDLAWETEAWIATDPTHMIHFDGERFLGPY